MKFYHKRLGTELHNPDPKSVSLFLSGKFKETDNFFFQTASGYSMITGMMNVENRIA